jgi:hypothetical protein
MRQFARALCGTGRSKKKGDLEGHSPSSGSTMLPCRRRSDDLRTKPTLPGFMIPHTRHCTLRNFLVAMISGQCVSGGNTARSDDARVTWSCGFGSAITLTTTSWWVDVEENRKDGQW